MSARTNIWTLALAIGLIPAALVGCSNDDTEVDTQGTPPATEVTPTTTEAVRVTGIDLGRGVGPDRKITDETGEFKPTDTIYASVNTAGSAMAGRPARFAVTVKMSFRYIATGSSPFSP